jgi:hypothetical protein
MMELCPFTILLSLSCSKNDRRIVSAFQKTKLPRGKILQLKSVSQTNVNVAKKNVHARARTNILTIILINVLQLLK